MIKKQHPTHTIGVTKLLKLLSITILALFLHNKIDADARVVTYLGPHSHSVDAARTLVNWGVQNQRIPKKGLHGNFVITPEVTESFRTERIAECFFGDNIIECKNTFTIAGSNIPTRNECDLLADYFGLPSDFESVAQIRPRATAAVFDFHLGLGNGRWYGYVHAPLVHTWWDMNLVEQVCKPGTADHPPGYFNPDGVPRSALLDCFSSFISGKNAPQVDGMSFEKLAATKIDPRILKTTSMAEAELMLGRYLIFGDHGHFGLHLRGSIPAGTRPCSDFLFNPIIGNGRHPAVGGGLTGRVVLKQYRTMSERASLHFVLDITHLFGSRQQRTFDLRCKPLSRYLLAARFNKPVTDNLQGGTQTPTAQFKQQFAPVANLTTACVDVSINAQVDFAVMLTYAKGDYAWNFGYGLWYRSCETFEKIGQLRLGLEQWALKGDAHMFGFMANNDPPLAINDAIALSATQSCARIGTGTNVPPGMPVSNITKQNPRIDNPRPAVAGATQTPLLRAPGLANTPDNQINTSIDPIFISPDDIDTNSARSYGMAHKIFGHFNYSWRGRRIIPHVGLGAQVEFGRRSGQTTLNDQSCINCALSVWTIWFKGGFSFRS